MAPSLTHWVLVELQLDRLAGTLDCVHSAAVDRYTNAVQRMSMGRACVKCRAYIPSFGVATTRRQLASNRGLNNAQLGKKFLHAFAQQLACSNLKGVCRRYAVNAGLGSICKNDHVIPMM